MHNSLITRLAVLLIIVLATAEGFMLHYFLEVVQPASPIIPLALAAGFIINLWAAWDLLDY
jgi:hypothetical protein